MKYPERTIEGLSIIRKRGIKWVAKIKCSRVRKEAKSRRPLGMGPRWVVVKVIRVYIAVIKVPAPVRIIVQWDQLKRETMTESSPIKLGRGGRAKLAKEVINHQAVAKGRAI